MNSMTSTSNLYTDARAELEEQLIRDPAQGDRKYLRLPSPSLRFPGVFVHNGGTTWGNAKWHVYCEFSSPVADAIESEVRRTPNSRSPRCSPMESHPAAREKLSPAARRSQTSLAAG